VPVKEPFLTFTNDQCIIGGGVFSGLPLLIDSENRIIEAPSDWLRYLRVIRREAADSVRQYAYHLKYWWSYLSRAGVAWDAVDDFIMMNWRDEFLQRGCDEEVVNRYLSTVFRMYLWAERNSYTHNLIGESDVERSIIPPLTVHIRIGHNKVRSCSSPLLIRTTAKPILPTPTNDDITKVHEALEELYGGNIDLMIRDGLVLSWMEQTGSRRAETLSLKRSQIPGWDEILVLEKTGEKKEITVIGKGSKRRLLWVGADLLSQTRDYIEEEREAVAARLRGRFGSSYKNPDEIFLSSKTGLPLHPDSISQKFAKAFRKAGVAGSGHRVRARFLTNLAVNTFEREFEKLGSIPDLTSTLLPVAQIAGHSDVNTLKAYLAFGVKRLLRQTAAERASAAEDKAIGAERRFDAALIKLKGIPAMSELAKAVKVGSRQKIIHELQKLQNIYS
jgi:integrase